MTEQPRRESAKQIAARILAGVPPPADMISNVNALREKREKEGGNV